MIHQDHDPIRRQASAAARALEWKLRFAGVDAFVSHAQKSAEISPAVYELSMDLLRNEQA